MSPLLRTPERVTRDPRGVTRAGVTNSRESSQGGAPATVSTGNQSGHTTKRLAKALFRASGIGTDTSTGQC